MKLRVILIVISAMIITGCNSNNCIEESKETVVREDNFVKEHASTPQIEQHTMGNGESNIREDEQPLKDIIENQSNGNITPVKRYNIWDIKEFKEINIGEDLYGFDITILKNANTINILDDKLEAEKDVLIYGISKVCEANNIDIDSIRLLDDIVKYSKDYSFKGLQLQSDDYYIDIAYSYIENILCYKITDKK